MLSSRPHYVAAGMLAVGTGHTLWMFDTISIITKFVTHGDRSFNSGPFNIADYNGIDGSPTFLSIYTTTHHLWFMPLCFHCLKNNHRYCHSNNLNFKQHLLIANYWIMFVSFMTVLIIPLECVVVNLNGGGTACVDINVNMVKQVTPSAERTTKARSEAMSNEKRFALLAK